MPLKMRLNKGHERPLVSQMLSYDEICKSQTIICFAGLLNECHVAKVVNKPPSRPPSCPKEG